MRILVTGSAGFIGFHLCQRLLARGDAVEGLDNLNDYYDPALKHARLDLLRQAPAFVFHHVDLADRDAMQKVFASGRFDVVVNLAAQAGVQYSLKNPHAYAESNVIGFLNILEGCRQAPPDHLVYASSSSVYGANRTFPFSTRDGVDHPVSLYAATKKSNELMAHCYSHLFALPTTGLRFFTVYGPWGRPDMAYYKFTKAILAGQPIDVFNNGQHARDLTYIDDIVEGVVRVMAAPPKSQSLDTVEAGNPASAQAPFRIFNIGNTEPVELMDLIATIERALGRDAKKNFLPMQPGDVERTCADVSDLTATVGFKPETSIHDGIDRFVTWYREYSAT